MTTYQTNATTTSTTYKEPSSNRGGIKIDNTAPGSLARRTQKTTGSSRSGSYGSGSRLSSGGKNNISPFARPRNNISPFRKPQNATQARRVNDSGNYGRKANARQNLGRAARTASCVAGAVGRRVAPVVGVNAKGEIDFGLRAGGFGVSASVSGRLSVSALSNTVTWKPGDKDDWSVESGFGLWSQDSTRNGCSVVITTRFNGKIISQQVREADDCREPDPTPEPTPTPTPTPKPPNEGEEPRRTASPMPPIPFKGLAEVRVRDAYGNDYSAAHNSNVWGFYCNGDETMVTIDLPFDNDWEEYDNKFTLIPIQRWSDKTGWYTIWEPSEHLIRYRQTIFRIYDSGEDVNGTDNYMPLGKNWYWQIGYMDAQGNMIQIGEGESLFSWYYKQVPPVNLSPNKRRVPKVNEECDCELLGKIYDMLGGDQFYEKGLTVPVELFTPGGSGGFKMRSYNEIMNIIFRTFSHRTPGEIEFTITDSNKGKEGDQSVQIKTLNAQGYYTMLLKSISNLGYENTDQMNLLVRLGVVTTQLMKLAVLVNQNLKNVLGFFDIPTKDVLEKVDVPFDLSLKGSLSKGFGSRQELQKELLKIVDKDTEEAIEGILDRFLNEWQMPVTTQRLRSTKEGGNFWYFLKQLRG